MFNDFLEVLKENNFDEIPVDAKTFVESTDFLGQPPLSDIQYDIVEAMSQIYKKEDLEELMGSVEGSKYYAKYKIVSKSGELGEDEIETARKNALMAKFSQNADLTTMLLDTRQALLKQFHPGKEATADILLMTVRKSLRGEKG